MTEALLACSSVLRPLPGDLSLIPKLPASPAGALGNELKPSDRNNKIAETPAGDFSWSYMGWLGLGAYKDSKGLYRGDMNRT